MWMVWMQRVGKMRRGKYCVSWIGLWFFFKEHECVYYLNWFHEYEWWFAKCMFNMQYLCTSMLKLFKLRLCIWVMWFMEVYIYIYTHTFLIVDMHNCKSRTECNMFKGVKPAMGCYWYSTWRHSGGCQAIRVPKMSLERVAPSSDEWTTRR